MTWLLPPRTFALILAGEVRSEALGIDLTAVVGSCAV